jgi:hypothetical protein
MSTATNPSTIVPKGVLKSEAYWKNHCEKIRNDRDLSISTFLKSHPISILVKTYPSTDKKILQMMHLSELRTYILKTAINPSAATMDYKLTKKYTISQILGIVLERALSVGLKLEALADINFDEMFKLAYEREKELEEWSTAQIQKIESKE